MHFNRDTVADRYPIPQIGKLVDAVVNQKGKWFTSLDLMIRFRNKTAFTCHLGLFHYRCMLFGLTNAPATFQHLMNKLFCNDEWNFAFG